MSNSIRKVAVLGAGTMGSGIAQVCAMHGYQVQVWDVSEGQLKWAKRKIIGNLDKGIERGKVSQESKEATLVNLSWVLELKEINADLIVEAVIEDTQIKVDLFRTLQEQLGTDVLLATNTSSIPITEIGAGLDDPSNLAGLHFFNPPHIMKLVEVIAGEATKEAVIDTLIAFTESIGKKGVIARDAPGFIVNRVARHYYVEGLKLLEEKISSHEGIDRLMESAGFRMGPFRLMDLIGVDSNYRVTESMFRSFNYDPKFRPSRIQYMKVQAGHYGKKSGKGFYEYK